VSGDTDRSDADRADADWAEADRAAISALVYSYAELIDAGDFAAVGALFAAATFRAAAGDQIHVRRGAKEVQSQFEQLVRLLPDGTPGTKHVTTNLVVALDAGAGTATARSYFTVLQAGPGGPGTDVAVVVAGRYHDRFTRHAGRSWRFADRLILTDLVGDVSRHLRGRPLG
jgi:3-phenylpropionate/cinnamic acid dioxygenase small subunit